MTGRFDNSCPWCLKSIDTADTHRTADYATSFTFDCHHCGKSIDVYAHQVPEFEFSREGCEDPKHGGSILMCPTCTKGLPGY